MLGNIISSPAKGSEIFRFAFYSVSSFQIALFECHFGRLDWGLAAGWWHSGPVKIRSLKWPSDQRFHSKRAAATFSRLVLRPYSSHWGGELRPALWHHVLHNKPEQSTQTFLSTTICTQTVDQPVSYKQGSLSKRFRSPLSFSSVQTSHCSLCFSTVFSRRHKMALIGHNVWNGLRLLLETWAELQLGQSDRSSFSLQPPKSVLLQHESPVRSDFTLFYWFSFNLWFSDLSFFLFLFLKPWRFSTMLVSGVRTPQSKCNHSVTWTAALKKIHCFWRSVSRWMWRKKALMKTWILFLLGFPLCLRRGRVRGQGEVSPRNRSAHVTNEVSSAPQSRVAIELVRLTWLPLVWHLVTFAVFSIFFSNRRLTPVLGRDFFSS